jgi:Spy/CpxP family protein refolding chaperone
VEAIRAELSTALAPVRAARTALAERFAASLEAGALDVAGIDASAAALERAETAAVPAVVKASDALHVALDATQRKALVATMRDKGKGGFHAFGGGRTRLKQLADDLGLSDDQRDQFKAAMRARHDETREGAGAFGAMRDRMRAQADAFVADRYDAASAGEGEQMAKGSARFVSRTRMLIESAMAILTPAQRVQLAVRIRSMSAG